MPVDGGRLYYREAGEGPAVILIHGGYLDHRMWDPQVDVLAESHRVIRYDVRSHGRSPAEEVSFSDVQDLVTLMDSLGVERATLVGLSMGGFIATDFALTHPRRVESLVLVGPGISGGRFDSPEILEYAGELRAAAERDEFEALIEVFTRYWCDGPHRTPAQVDPAVRSKVLEMLSGSRERWEHDAFVQALEPPAWDRVSDVQAPTLVVLGTIDMPDIHLIVDHLAEHLPNAQRLDIPGVAHMVNMEAPDLFNQAILAFLEGIRDGRIGTPRTPRGPAAPVSTWSRRMGADTNGGWGGIPGNQG